MFDCGHEASDLAAWIDSLSCSVRLPLRLQKDFEKTGVTAPFYGDVRSVQRMTWRGAGRRAALEYRQSLPTLPRNPAWFGVYMNDLSHQGCGFFHGEQLYPGERMRLVLPTGTDLPIEVRWCHRVDENCFEIGARFVTGVSPPKPEQSHA